MPSQHLRNSSLQNFIIIGASPPADGATFTEHEKPLLLGIDIPSTFGHRLQKDVLFILTMGSRMNARWAQAPVDWDACPFEWPQSPSEQ